MPRRILESLSQPHEAAAAWQDLAPSGGAEIDGAAGHNLELPKGKQHLAEERRWAGWTDRAAQQGEQDSEINHPKSIPEPLSHAAGSKRGCWPRPWL